MKAKYLAQDWEARLHGGIVRWIDKPVRIMIDGNGLSLYDIAEGGLLVQGIDPLDDRLDISSVPLGYINHTRAVYLARSPLRRYKQSVDIRGVRAYVLAAKEFIDSGQGELIFTDAYKKSYDPNGWPTVPRVLEVLSKAGRAHSLAISREVAMSVDRSDDPKNINVFWKFDHVGTVEIGTNVVKVLETDMSFLVSKELSKYVGWEIQ